MSYDLQNAMDDEGGQFFGNIVMHSSVVMHSCHYDLIASDAEDESLMADYPVGHGCGRYSDRPMDWRTRLFGTSGTVAVMALVLGCALFSWSIVRPVAVAPSAPLVVELRPLAAPPEPVRDVAPGPDQVEREETKPMPKAELDPLLPLTQLATTPHEAPEPTQEAVNPSPMIPETTAPRSIPAPAAARMSSDAKQTWEARLLAHLEQYRRFPARARAARQQGVVYLRFRMNRSGMVLSAKVLRSSGFTTLDQAALDTLKRAEPLPAIPDDRPDVIDLTIPVEFYLNARS